jgi:lysozyme
MNKNAPHTLGPAGLAIIKTSEELRLQVYLCPANKMTIGWGHVLLPKWDAGLFKNLDSTALARIIDECQRRKTITREAKALLYINLDQAKELLARDTNQTALFINSVTPVELTQNQFDALCSFVFNIGQGDYATSTLLKKLKAGDIAGAAAEFGRWKYGAVDGVKKVMPGLITRRAAESALFESL